MSYKIKIRWLIIATVLIFCVSTILYYTGNKFDNAGNFIGNPFDDLQQFLDFFSVLSFISLIILYFLPEQIFITWFKFARIYIPIALVLAVGGGATSNGSDLFNTDAEFFTTFFSVIFVVISIILIIRAHCRLKRQAKTPPSIVGG